MKQYYQPEMTDKFVNEFPDFYSFFVFRSKKLAEFIFPDSLILTYSGDDIENPTYVDNEYAMYNIDLKELTERLEKEFGFKLAVYAKVHPTRFGSKCRVELSTTNLVTQTGIFKNCFSHVEVGNHGGGVPDSDGKFWFLLHIYYKHVEGGSNGVKLADAWYNSVDRTWEFQFVGEK